MADKTAPEANYVKVGDVMAKHVACIDAKETVASAVRMMKDKKVSSLIVNRRAPEETWGIITRKDVVNKVVATGKDPYFVKVSEVMTRPVIMVYPDLSLQDCARLLHHAGIRRAPVFDGKEIVGIVSNTDIFNAIKV